MLDTGSDSSDSRIVVCDATPPLSLALRSDIGFGYSPNNVDLDNGSSTLPGSHPTGEDGNGSNDLDCIDSNPAWQLGCLPHATLLPQIVVRSIARGPRMYLLQGHSVPWRERDNLHSWGIYNMALLDARS
jgi:hypothetical protein